MALIERPYHYEQLMDITGAKSEDGVPVYFDGYAYNGVLNIQPVVQCWPATAGIGLEENRALEALELQSAPSDYNTDEEAMKIERIRNEKRNRMKDQS